MKRLATMLAALVLVLLSTPRTLAQYTGQHAPRFERPELGLSMSLSLGGLFGMVGGSLLIAPLPWLVLEPGVAQRLREGPRPVALVRVRFARFRNTAISAGVGLEHRSKYESVEIDCVFSEYECGRFARNVWGAPVQLMLEVRFRSAVTLGPHVGLKVPLAWDDCRSYGEGGDRGSCVPLLRPFFGLTVSWAAPLGRAPAQSVDATGGVNP